MSSFVRRLQRRGKTGVLNPNAKDLLARLAREEKRKQQQENA